ncbi:conserved hypothetical protein, putative [Luminiphilus syltensis NOR5-1B]|uniref:EthD domain-containing protein n=2 Tax=Luminiphilus TaxID=1341118 RepID=B8KXJ6_9GAMM|nr:conserved hypothetical protein, putative [Luminiphilus syltensis NOR5-1B]
MNHDDVDLNGGHEVSACYELRIEGPPESGPALRSVIAGLAFDLGSLDGLVSADVYRPGEGSVNDPYFDHADAPLAILMLDFTDDEARAEGLLQCQALKRFGAIEGLSITSAFLRRIAYALEPGAAPPPFTAPISNVVRYRRPHSDEQAFTTFYLETHPITQQRLPGIGAIHCYLPQQGVDPNGYDDADYVMGNEVSFDDLAGFNGAMRSEVREEMRAHFRQFPAFTGLLTHDYMQRERLLGDP